MTMATGLTVSKIVRGQRSEDSGQNKTLKVVSESRWLPLCHFFVFLRLCYRLRPSVRNRQTDVRLLNAPTLGSGA